MAAAALLENRFELGVRAASGAMGSVYRGLDRQTGTAVAVKLLDLSGEADRARFVREANVLARLDHPNLVRYIAHGVTPDGIHFLVQDWAEGVTLRKLLNTTGVTARDALAIVRGLVAGLAAAHALGIIHRDIKPDNLILDPGRPDQVKVVDFGIARLTDTALKLTRTGTVIGTPSYMSPEQARGDTVDLPTDIWAAGCVLYEMLSGRQAFAGTSPMAIRAKVMMDRPAPLATLSQEAPAEVIACVERMIARAPDQRPTLDEIAGVLASATVADGPHRVVGTPEPATAVLPSAKHGHNASSFVFLGAASLEDSAPNVVQLLGDLATNYGLDSHRFEDGSAVFAARDRGKPGALAAARAALQMFGRVPGCAVSIVANATGEPVAETFERGAHTLQRAVLGEVFADVVEGTARGVHVDEVVADLIRDELTVIERDGNRLLVERPG